MHRSFARGRVIALTKHDIVQRDSWPLRHRRAALFLRWSIKASTQIRL